MINSFANDFCKKGLPKIKDNKGVIRSCKWKDRQHSGQKKKDKRTNNDLQNISQKTKD